MGQKVIGHFGPTLANLNVRVLLQVNFGMLVGSINANLKFTGARAKCGWPLWSTDLVSAKDKYKLVVNAADH